MEFQKKTSMSNSNGVIKVFIKITLVFLLLFLSIVLVDKIDFPSPNKKIEKIVPSENLKIVK
tara:strand:- start:107 stop:292 length:186 start_codon:yes stop_codon:yes gene_type:complete